VYCRETVRDLENERIWNKRKSEEVVFLDPGKKNHRKEVHGATRTETRSRRAGTKINVHVKTPVNSVRPDQKGGK